MKISKSKFRAARYMPSVYSLAQKSSSSFVKGALTNFPVFHCNTGEQLFFSSSTALPIPLPPLVANGTIVLPVKSHLSRKVLIMCGAMYHQMGKPKNMTS